MHCSAAPVSEASAVNGRSPWNVTCVAGTPTLVISGGDDPVGSFGKGPDYVYKQLMVSGVSDVTLKLYEGARHELFNETNRMEVFADMLAWIEGGRGK